jgi:ABC-type sugar transport system permease subunit
LLVVLPLPAIIALSLCDWNLTRAPLPRFVGAANYTRMFADSAFWRSLSNTFVLTAEATVLQIVTGVGIAMLFNRDWPGMGFIRALFLAPMMIAPIFVGMIWRLMLSNDFGIVKYVLSVIGVTNPPLWLDDPAFALQTIVAVSVWQWTAFVVLFAVAGLQAIPGDGAGAIGRSGPVQQLRNRGVFVGAQPLPWRDRSLQVPDGSRRLPWLDVRYGLGL